MKAVIKIGGGGFSKSCGLKSLCFLAIQTGLSMVVISTQASSEVESFVSKDLLLTFLFRRAVLSTVRAGLPKINSRSTLPSVRHQNRVLRYTGSLYRSDLARGPGVEHPYPKWPCGHGCIRSPDSALAFQPQANAIFWLKSSPSIGLAIPFRACCCCSPHFLAIAMKTCTPTARRGAGRCAHVLREDVAHSVRRPTDAACQGSLSSRNGNRHPWAGVGCPKRGISHVQQESATRLAKQD